MSSSASPTLKSPAILSKRSRTDQVATSFLTKLTVFCSCLVSYIGFCPADNRHTARARIHCRIDPPPACRSIPETSSLSKSVMGKTNKPLSVRFCSRLQAVYQRFDQLWIIPSSCRALTAVLLTINQRGLCQPFLSDQRIDPLPFSHHKP